MRKRIILILIIGATIISCSSVKQVETVTIDELKQMNSVEVDKKAKELLKSDKEADYATLIEYYESISENRKALETINKAVDKFPNGEYAAQKQIKYNWKVKSIDQKFAFIEELENSFPKHDFSKQYFELVFNALYVNNLASAIKYYNKLAKTDLIRYSALSQIAPKIKDNSVVNKVDFLRTELENVVTNIDASNTKKDNIVNNTKLDLARALQEAGKLDEAVIVLEDIYENSTTSDRIGLTYGMMLVKCKRYAKALPILEEGIINGVATDDVKAALKESYEAVGKTDYQTYLDGLMVKMHETIGDDIAKLVINEPCPKFVLTDTKGNIVSSDDFRGKTIVLDFWATWCGPCKASFPAMKEAANKYKNNPNVKFLFVHTFEKGKEAVAEAKKYLQDNDYDFDLYMDLKNSTTRTNQAAEALNIHAIPTKIVVDPNGNIRFRATGASLSKDKVVSELSAVIDIIENKK